MRSWMLNKMIVDRIFAAVLKSWQLIPRHILGLSACQSASLDHDVVFVRSWHLKRGLQSGSGSMSLPCPQSRSWLVQLQMEVLGFSQNSSLENTGKQISYRIVLVTTMFFMFTNVRRVGGERWRYAWFGWPTFSKIFLSEQQPASIEFQSEQSHLGHLNESRFYQLQCTVLSYLRISKWKTNLRLITIVKNSPDITFQIRELCQYLASTST